MKRNQKSSMRHWADQILRAARQSALHPLLWPAIALMLQPQAANAQEEEDDDIFELSPFEVDASEDTGYRATETLAGTRLSTDMKDLASSITVLTEDFLEDTGSTNPKDFLIYVANAEAGGFGGNTTGMTGGRGRGAFITDDTGLINNTQNTRVRGLANASITRDFFLSQIPIDTFNTDRVDIQRGPNAILFGLGSPGGIINNTLSKAKFSDDLEVEFRLTQHGGERAVVDVNKQILDDQLAVRVIGLHDMQKFKQDPAFVKDQRVYAAMRWKPKHRFFENSEVVDRPTFDANLEIGDIEANRPRTLPPRETLTAWFEAGKPTVDASDTDQNFFNLLGNPDFVDADGNPLAGPLGRTQWFPTLVFPDNESELPGGPGTPELMAWVDQQIAGIPNMRTFTSVAVLDRRLARGGDPRSGFFTTPTLDDKSIFDFTNQLIDGPNKWENEDFEAYNVKYEQTFFDKRVGWAFEYNDQKIDRFNGGFLRNQRAAIMPDWNLTLMNGEPNPNFGRATVASQGRIGRDGSDMEVLRLTAFARFDFEDFSPSEGLLNRILGDHTFTFLHDDLEEENYDRGGLMGATGEDHRPFTVGSNGQNIRNIRREIAIMRFLGDENLFERSELSGADLPNIQSPTFIPDSANSLVFDKPTFEETGEAQLITRPFSIVNFQNAEDSLWLGTNKISEETESNAIIWTGRLFNDNIVGTYGWREDDFYSARVTAPIDPVFGNRLVNDPSFAFPDPQSGEFFSGDTITWSVVGHTPNFIEDRLPFDASLSAHYGESENFQPAGARFTVLGDQIGPPSGETEEMGFTLSLFQGKFVGRFNWFDTTQSLGTADPVASIFWVGQGEVEALNAVNGLNGFEQDPDAVAAFTPPPQELKDFWEFTKDEEGRYQSVSGNTPPVSNVQDQVSEGLEIELVFRPTSNWDNSLNIARQEATIDNTGSLIEDHLESRIPVWEAAGDLIMANGERFGDRMRAEVIVPWRITQASDGQIVDELREWRVNYITNYRFDERFPNFLQGFGIGGAVRWQDNATIGNETTTVEGELITDVDSPIVGDTRLSGDFWASYERPLFNDTVDWSIRLNLRNVFADDDLIPVVANPDGSIAVSRIAADTTWELTSRFSF